MKKIVLTVFKGNNTPCSICDCQVVYVSVSHSVEAYIVIILANCFITSLTHFFSCLFGLPWTKDLAKKLD